MYCIKTNKKTKDECEVRIRILTFPINLIYFSETLEYL